MFFENRGKRWYNHNIVYPLYSHRLLTPTYDTDFLNVVSSIPYNYRIGDRFRVDLLKIIDQGISNIPYDATMQPAWLTSPFTKKFKDKLDEIEKLQLEIWFDTGGKIYLPSNRYDVNFQEWLRVYPEYQLYFEKILTGDESILCNLYLNREKIKELINLHINKNMSFHKILVMLISAELSCRLFLNNDFNINNKFLDFSSFFE